VSDEATELVTIEAVGPARPAGGLMWGQRLLWNDAQWLGDGDHHLNLARNAPVPDGVPLDQVLACLVRLVERHEVLRSRIVVDDAGEPGQHVAAYAHMKVLVLSFPAGTVPANDPEFFPRMETWPFRFPGDWPIQFAVASVGGRPHTVVFVVSHIAVDGTATDLLLDELRVLLAKGPGTELPPVTTRPLDRVEWQRSAAGRRTSERALQRMAEQLCSSPQTMFAVPRREPDQPRFRRMEMRSPTLAAALREVATRCAVSTSTVLLAGTAAMLGAVTGHRVVLIKGIASNRGFPDTRDVIGVTVGNALFRLDLADGDFPDLVRAAAAESLRSLMRAQCDPVERDRLVDRINHERGVHVDLAAFFNDFRSPDDTFAAGPTVTRWVGAWDRLDLKFFFHAFADAVFLTVDTAFVAGEHVPRLLTGLERLVVAAAAGPAPLDDLTRYFEGVPEPPRPGWVRIGPDWVEPSVVAALLAGLVEPSAVFADPGGGLTAFVAGESVDPAALHRGMVRALAGHPTAVAPGRYVVCRHPPADRLSRTAWEAAA
jgi:hypothetical protein